MEETLYGTDGHADPTRIAMALHRWKHAGKKVHIIFDADHVLVSGRSHDVFEMLERDVPSYRKYEARQFLQLMDEGPWTYLARQVGNRFTSQDIVTARAGYSALRVMFFCLAHRLDFHDMLFVGGQSKATSYGEILKRFEDKPEWRVLMLDDSVRHVEDFDRVAREMSMRERCYPLLTHRERDYTDAQLRRHFDDVMQDASGSRPFVAGDGTDASPRHFLVTPDAHGAMLRMLQSEADEVRDDLLRSLIRKPAPAEDPFTENALAWKEAYDRGEPVPEHMKRFFERAAKAAEAHARAHGDWYESPDLGESPSDD